MTVPRISDSLEPFFFVIIRNVARSIDKVAIDCGYSSINYTNFSTEPIVLLPGYCSIIPKGLNPQSGIYPGCNPVDHARKPSPKSPTLKGLNSTTFVVGGYPAYLPFPFQDPDSQRWFYPGRGLKRAAEMLHFFFFSVWRPTLFTYSTFCQKQNLYVMVKMIGNG